MAKCDEGYLCQVCGEAVESLEESELYLRYVVGWVDPELLHTSPDRHLKCNPTLAQFILDSRFPAIECEGPFAKQELDSAEVDRRQTVLTRGWRRLLEIKGSGIPLTEYPLEEVRAKWASDD